MLEARPFKFILNCWE